MGAGWGQVRSRGPQVRIESGVFRLVRDLGGGALPAVAEAVAVAVHLQDMHVVGEAVQQGSGEAVRAKHLGPLIERQVGGDQDAAALVALGEDLEEKFRSGGGQGDEAQFVDDQQAEAGQIPLQGEQPPLVPGFQRSALRRRHGRDAPARFHSRCTSLPWRCWTTGSAAWSRSQERQPRPAPAGGPGWKQGCFQPPAVNSPCRS